MEYPPSGHTVLYPARYYVRFECDDHTAAAEAVLLKVRLPPTHPPYRSTRQYSRVP